MPNLKMRQKTKTEQKLIYLNRVDVSTYRQIKFSAQFVCKIPFWILQTQLFKRVHNF